MSLIPIPFHGLGAPFVGPIPASGFPLSNLPISSGLPGSIPPGVVVGLRPGGPVGLFRNKEPREEYSKLRREVGRQPKMIANRPGGFAIFEDGKFVHVLKDEAIVHADAGKPVPQTTQKKFLYTTIGYKIPANRVQDVQKMSESLIIDLLKNEITARCASTAANYATLRAAIEVAKRTGPVTIDTHGVYKTLLTTKDTNKTENKNFVKKEAKTVIESSHAYVRT